LDGEHNPVLSETLIGLEVVESLDSAAHCRARFVNVGSGPDGRTEYLFCDRSILDFGREIGVEIGFGQGAASIFEGRISALDTAYPPGSPPEFAILVEDSLGEMRLPHRTRLFNNLTIPEVIEAVASDHGLPVQANLHLSYPHLAALAQFEQSDLSFLFDCARRYGLDLWVRQGVLVMTDQRTGGNEIRLSYGEELSSFHARADLAEQVTSLTASGWDVQGKQVAAAVADVSAIQDELDSRRSGSQYLLEAYGERKEHLPDILPSNAAEAQALAEAAYRQRARRFVSGVALTEGNPDLQLGGRVELAGIGPLFSGSYTIERVRHLYDRQSGYRSELLVSRPGLEAKRGARPSKVKPKGQVQRRPSKVSLPAKKPVRRKR
jgi:phage protein D